MEELTLSEAKERLFKMLDKMKYKRPIWQDYVIFENEEKGYLKVRMFTNIFTHTITVAFKDNDFMSGYSEARMSRPGEKYRRGNDLYSGRFCQETLDQIVYDMFSYELVSIYKQHKKFYPDSKVEEAVEEKS